METCRSKHSGPLPPSVACAVCVCLCVSVGLSLQGLLPLQLCSKLQKGERGFPSCRAAQRQLAEKPLLIDWAEFWDGAGCLKCTSPLLSQRKQASLANAAPALPH